MPYELREKCYKRETQNYRSIDCDRLSLTTALCV